MTKKNIFADNAPKYFEAGYNPIPLNGKVPLVRGWQDLSKRRISEEELDLMIEQFPNANIGIVLGFNCCALDVDTDDPDVLRAVPYSPLRRKGKKGVVCLFAKTHALNHPQAGTPVEFLNIGRQIVVPPSIHPETNEPYEWVGESDVFTASQDELPQYSHTLLENIKRVCEKKKLISKKRAESTDGAAANFIVDAGRNSRIVAKMYAMACHGADAATIAKEALEYDKREHATHERGPWFLDVNEPHRARNPQALALKDAERAIRAATKRGEIVPFSDIVFSPAIFEKKAVVDSWKPYPAPRGMMRMFLEYCQASSIGNQDALGLGGAIALMSVICSNRFRTRAGSFEVWPNMMVLNIAYSGFGKETCQRTLDDLLADTELLGSAGYRSGTSIVMGLPKQQERLDVIDECSMLLKAMGGKEDYKSEIVEVLSSLYTKSSSKFNGFSSQANGTRHGACWNPCVNILGSTTPAGFKSSVTAAMAAKGLLPRFLVFYQKYAGEYRLTASPETLEQMLRRIKASVRRVLEVEKIEVDSGGVVDLTDGGESKRYCPQLVPMSEGAQRLWHSLSRGYYTDSTKSPEDFASPFKNRFAQLIAKLALLDAISLGQDEIDSDNIHWAHSVVETQWANASELYEFAGAENETEQDVVKCLQLIRSNPGITITALTKKTQGLPPHKRRDVLNTLVESGQILRVKDDTVGPGRKADRFFILEAN